MIKDYHFKVIVSPDKTKDEIYKLLINYKKNISKYLKLEDILEVSDI